MNYTDPLDLTISEADDPCMDIENASLKTQYTSTVARFIKRIGVARAISTTAIPRKGVYALDFIIKSDASIPTSQTTICGNITIGFGYIVARNPGSVLTGHGPGIWGCSGPVKIGTDHMFAFTTEELQTGCTLLRMVCNWTARTVTMKSRGDSTVCRFPIERPEYPEKVVDIFVRNVNVPFSVWVRPCKATREERDTSSSSEVSLAKRLKTIGGPDY